MSAGFKPYEEDACESVDASVFTGDMLYRDEALLQFEEYVARWQRAIDARKAELEEEKRQGT